MCLLISTWGRPGLPLLCLVDLLRQGLTGGQVFCHGSGWFSTCMHCETAETRVGPLAACPTQVIGLGGLCLVPQVAWLYRVPTAWVGPVLCEISL